MNKNSFDASKKLIIDAVMDAASRLLYGDISALEASRLIGQYRHNFDGELFEALTVFSAIDSETDDLPIGHVRALWSTEALKRCDSEIAKSEALYRDVAIEAAKTILRITTASRCNSSDIKSEGSQPT